MKPAGVKRRSDPRLDLAGHCAELLAGLGSVRTRRMFGGFGLYLDEVFFAFIAGETLYLKADAHTVERFRSAGSKPFAYDSGERSITMSYMSAPAEAMESAALMAPWARLALEAALRARTAKLTRTPKARLSVKAAAPNRAAKPAPSGRRAKTPAS